MKLKKLIGRVATSGLACLIGGLAITASTSNTFATENYLANKIGQTVSLKDNYTEVFTVDGKAKPVKLKRLSGVEDTIYSLSFNDEDESTGVVVNSTLSEEESYKIGSGLKYLSENGGTVSDAQSLVWTIKTGNEVLPLKSASKEKLKDIYSKLKTNSLIDNLKEHKLSHVGIVGKNSSYVAFYFDPIENAKAIEEPKATEVATEKVEENTPTPEPQPSSETEAQSELIAKSFNQKSGNINVLVKAPEGALPDGTTMQIRPLKGTELEQFKEDVAKKSNKIVYSGQAVDISFYNKDGKEIEPEKEIDVKISLDYALPSGEQVVAHKKDNGEVNIATEATATQNTAHFKTKEFSIWGTVTAGWVGGLQAYNDGENVHKYYELQYNGKPAFCMDWGKDMPDGSSYTERDILDVIPLEEAKNLVALIYKYRERVGHQGSYYELQALIWSYYTGKRIYSDGIADPNSIFDCIDDFNMLNNSGRLDDLKRNLHPVGSIATPNGGDYQRLISLDYVVTHDGSVSLKKESSNPSVTNGSTCYSLENAEFTLTKVDETNITYKLVTNSNGDAHVDHVRTGEYRVVETKAPKGFSKNTNIPNITVSQGQDTKFTVKDKPLLDPIPIYIKKVNSNGEKSNPQGNATLEGAEFEIKFYDRYFDNNNVTGKATRTWVFATKKSASGSYRLYTSNNYKVRGDDLYRNGSIPLGTIVIKEVKAPKGYLVNPTTYVGKIMEENGKAKVDLPRLTYTAEGSFELNEETVKGNLQIIKKDGLSVSMLHGNATLENTQFDVINKSKAPVYYNGKMINVGGVVTTLTIKYDNNLKAFVAKADGLPYGSYVITETKPGLGYTINRSEFKAEINSEKQVDVDVTNDIIKGSVKIVKTDNITNSNPQGNGELEGTEFAVINKSKAPVYYAGKKIEVDGIVTSIKTSFNEDLKVFEAKADNLPYGSYIVKEVTPGEGYKLNAEEFNVIIKDSKTVTVNVSNEIKRGNLQITKKDLNLGDANQGNAELENTSFTLVNSSKESVSYEGKVIAPGKEVTALTIKYDETTNKFIANAEGLPYGTYTLKETKPGIGYRVNEKEFTVVIRGEENVNLDVTNDIQKANLQIIKKDKDLLDYSQGDGKLEGVEFAVINKSKAPVYYAGKKIEVDGIVTTIKTAFNEDLKVFEAKADNLPYGSYIVKEVISGEGYKLNAEELNVTVNENKTILLNVTNEIKRGNLQITKKDLNLGDANQGNAELENTSFTLINSSKESVSYEGKVIAPGSEVTTLTVKYDEITKKFEAKADNLPYGKYTVRETHSGTGYRVNEKEFTVVIPGEENVNLDVTNDIQKANLQIIKKDKDLLDYSQGDGKLEGVEFAIINKSKAPVYYAGKKIEVDGIVTTIKTAFNEDLKVFEAKADDLPYGSYIVKEVTPGEGYKLNAEEFNVEVRSEENISLDINNEIKSGKIKVVKLDEEFKKSEAQKGTNLSDIEFEVINKSVNSIVYEGKTYKTDELVTKIKTSWNETDKEYNAYTKNLPYGTYEIKEVKSNEYYSLGKETVKTVKITDDNGLVTAEFINHVKRNDVEMVKVELGSSKRVSAPFKITLYEDETRTKAIEEHVIVTDENGQFSTSYNPHDNNTNANDDLLTKKDITAEDIKAAIKKQSGTWFTLGEFGSKAKADNSRGALPYGFYKLTELACENNSRLSLVEFNFEINQDRYPVNFGTVDDVPIKIHTTAIDKNTGIKEGVIGETIIQDSIFFEGFTIGKTYEFVAHPKDPETGEILKDKEGKEIEVKAKFVADRNTGKFVIDIPIDSTYLENKSVVICENGYEEGRLVAVHNDLKDTDQTVTFPKKEESVKLIPTPPTGDRSNLLLWLPIIFGTTFVLTMAIQHFWDRRKLE